ncbi:unnamed protein product, partial [marine sediment metagenome]
GVFTGDVTMSGADILLGSNALKTTNCSILELSATALKLRNAADTIYRSLFLQGLYFYEVIAAQADALSINAGAADDDYLTLKARDNGDGLVEVARLQAAADPYLQATLPMVLKPTARPGTPVAGHKVLNTTSGDVEHYDGVAYRQRVHSVCRQIMHDSSTPFTIVTLPPGSIIIGAFIHITEAWNGT